MSEITNPELNDDVDVLYESITSPRDTSVPMSAPKEPDMFEFTANGKQIKAGKEDVLKWASQGHDYSQKMSEFKSIKEQYDPLINRYKEIDQYAKDNPDWMQFVEQQWQNRDNLQKEITEPNDDLQLLRQEIADLKNFKNEFVTKERTQKQHEEDKMLDMEIKSIRDQYPNLDWNSYDPSGHNLEKKVLDHAMNIGTTNFRAAFRDYMHERLVEQAKESGKEIVTKELSKKTKLGLLGESTTPTKGIKSAGNVKNKSYEDLMREGLEEL